MPPSPLVGLSLSEQPQESYLVRQRRCLEVSQLKDLLLHNLPFKVSVSTVSLIGEIWVNGSHFTEWAEGTRALKGKDRKEQHVTRHLPPSCLSLAGL